MNSKEWMTAIGKLFKLLIEGERTIEALRKQLNNQPDFDPLLLFRRIDFEQKKHIAQDNFIKFLNLHKLTGNLNEINFVLMMYESDSSKSMNYNQFLNMVLCKEYYSTKKSQDGHQYYITKETEKLFATLLQSELRLAKNVFSVLPLIIKQEGFTVQEVIRELKGNVYLTEENLENMTQFGLPNVSREQLKGLMKRLDLTRNGRITVEELNKLLYFPHEKPPNILFSIRRPISMKQSNSVNVYQQNVNKTEHNLSNRRVNNNSNTYYLMTDANRRTNGNFNNIQMKRPNYNSFQTESNVNQSRRLIMETEEVRPVVYQYDNRNTQINDNINHQREMEINSSNYQPVSTLPNNFDNNTQRRSYPNINNQQESRNNNFLPNQRRNIRISTDGYNEHPTLFETNYITTIPDSRRTDLPLHTINSTFSINERINNQERQHQQQQQQLQNQSTSNIRLNNGQFSSNSVFPIRVSDTLSIRQSPERNIEDYYNRNSSRREIKYRILKQAREQHGIGEEELSTEEDLIITIWKQIIEIEKIIENEKIKLSSQQDFNIEDCVRIFETKQHQLLLSFSDIKLGYASFNLFPSKKELELLLKKYDLNKKGYLDYGDFFDMLTPFKKSIRNEMEKRRPNKYCPSFNKTNVFNGITKGLIKGLLSILINSESHLNNLRKAVNSETENEETIRQLFSKIDNERKGYLTPENITHFLKENSIIYTQNDIDLLYIRFDKDRDGKIQYEEFLEEFTLIV